MRHPTWDAIRRFCEVDGWTTTHVKRGTKRRDHDRFQKTLPEGRILRTGASHGRAEIGDPGLVSRILRHQLEVSVEEFWEAVDNGNPPLRTPDVVTTPTETGPAHRLEDWLAVQLTVIVGLPDVEVSELTQEAAMKIWTEWVRQSGENG